MSSDCAFDFLFATWHGGGNVAPALTAARKLIAAGHRVRFMSDLCDRAGAEAAGAVFVPWRRAPSRADGSPASDPVRDWEAASPADGVGRLFDRLFCGPALDYARDLLDEMAAHRPDLVVSSEMLFGVMAACEAVRQPLTLLAANLSIYPIPGIPPFGPGLLPARSDAERALQAEIAAGGRALFNRGLPALNQARRALGLAPLGDLLEQLDAAERRLLATSQAFDFPADGLPAHIRYVGPQLDQPTWVGPWETPWAAEDPRRCVLVALSTTFQDQAATLARIVAALGRLPVRALVTLGPNIAAADLPAAPPNVLLCRGAPHDAVMREAAVVVTHAGHGTVMRALTHRVPLLCLPMGRDQDDNAARVVAHGAGLALPPGASSDEILAALGRLLDEPQFLLAALRLGDAVAAEAASPMLLAELTTRAAFHRFRQTCGKAAA